MCNTRVYVAFCITVDPEGAAVVLYQLPFAEVCQGVLCVSWHGDTLSRMDSTPCVKGRTLRKDRGGEGTYSKGCLHDAELPLDRLVPRHVLDGNLYLRSKD